MHGNEIPFTRGVLHDGEVEIASLGSRPASPAAHLVVFPHAGGSPRSFARWVAALPQDMAFHGVTYPGRDTLMGRPVADSIHELADAATDLVEALTGGDVPMLMFGHSMGSLVAFETALRLRERGVRPEALFASGVNAPGLRPPSDWHRASDDALIEHISDLDPRTAAVLAEPELRALFLPTIRADYRLVEQYVPTDGTLDCPIHTLNGDADTQIQPEPVAAWRRRTTAEYRAQVWPGDHFYLFPRSAEVTRYISDMLRTAQPTIPGATTF